MQKAIIYQDVGFTLLKDYWTSKNYNNGCSTDQINNGQN